MSPLNVMPYAKVHKNDNRDAEAIAETATRPTMPFVAIKSEGNWTFMPCIACANAWCATGPG